MEGGGTFFVAFAMLKFFSNHVLRLLCCEKQIDEIEHHAMGRTHCVQLVVNELLWENLINQQLIISIL